MSEELEALKKRVAVLEEWVAETERGIATLPDALRRAFEEQPLDSRSP